MPNGVDPVSAATVGIALDVQPLNHGVACDQCGGTEGGTLAISTVTGIDGRFQLTLDSLPQASSVQLWVQKARFRRVTAVPVIACTQNQLSGSPLSLPGHASQGDVPKIAVTSGNSDHLAKVLDDLGIEYDCFRDTGTSAQDTCASSSTTLEQLLLTPTTLQSYGMLFISCSFSGLYESDLASASGNGPTMRQNLSDYVDAGGKVIITDDSYDYVEQVFPEMINFEPATSTPSVPQPVNAAQIGIYTDSLNGTLSDGDMIAWLQNLGALNSDGTVALYGFLDQWAVMNSVDPSAEVLVTGNVSWTSPQGGSLSGSRPLTVQFERNHCGRVIFSSYHTDNGSTAASPLPQERILEYLMLQVGTCVVSR
jgi:hypothetical protein